MAHKSRPKEFWALLNQLLNSDKKFHSLFKNVDLKVRKGKFVKKGKELDEKVDANFRENLITNEIVNIGIGEFMP